MFRYLSLLTQRYLRTDKQKAYAEFFLIVALLASLTWFVFRPNFLAVLDLNQKLAEARVVDQSLDRKLDNLDKAQASLKNVSSDLPFLESALPQKSLILDFLNNISGLASLDGVDLIESSYQEPRSTTAYQGKPFETRSTLVNSEIKALNFPFTIRLKGNYPALRRFTADLENLPRLLTVDTFDFNKEVRENSLEVIISGRAFWFAGP